MTLVEGLEIHHRLADTEQATTCYQLAVEIFRELGNRPDEAENLILMGDVLRDAGSADQALRAWRHALAIIEELRLPGSDPVRERIQAWS